jgi:RimJ/RimL family protein N-acetyltransferase
MIVSRTERLRLRELTADDAGFIMELVNEPAWLRFIGDRKVHSLDDARGYIAKGPAASYARNGFGLWAVELAAAGEPIGMCGLVRRQALEHVDLGFAFLSRHWGHGYAREAAAAAVERAREAFHLTRLVAITDLDNLPSQKVLTSVGFEYDKLVHWPESGEDLALYALDLTAPAPGGMPRTERRPA